MSMKLRKNLGRLATAFVATAMLASLSAVPASAADADEGEQIPVIADDGSSISEEKPYQEGNSFYITKYLTKDEKTMVPNLEFAFDVSPVTSVSGERNNMPLKAGIQGGVTADTEEKASFTPGDELDDSTKVYEKAKFNVNLDSFMPSGPDDSVHGVGVYKYSIKELDTNTGAATGVTKDTTTLDLYVYIVNDDNPNDEVGNGTLKVAYTELVRRKGNYNTAKMDSFTNDYGANPGNETMVNDLVVYKVLTGDAADMGDTFDFTVRIDGERDEKYYVEFGTYTFNEQGVGTFTSNNKTTIWTSGSPETVNLGNNAAFKVYGLDQNDQYTVVEDEDSAAGYTVKIDGRESQDRKATGTLSDDGVIKFENNKQSVTPTGIVMNVAPYALLVVVAAGACFVFLRKRRED